MGRRNQHVTSRPYQPTYQPGITDNQTTTHEKAQPTIHLLGDMHGTEQQHSEGEARLLGVEDAHGDGVADARGHLVQLLRRLDPHAPAPPRVVPAARRLQPRPQRHAASRVWPADHGAGALRAGGGGLSHCRRCVGVGFFSCGAVRCGAVLVLRRWICGGRLRGWE